jgi:hypothetical protein
LLEIREDGELRIQNINCSLPEFEESGIGKHLFKESQIGAQKRVDLNLRKSGIDKYIFKIKIQKR